MDAVMWKTIFLTSLKVNKPAGCVVYIKNWPPSHVSGGTVGLICSTDICLSTLGV